MLRLDESINLDSLRLNHHCIWRQWTVTKHNNPTQVNRNILVNSEQTNRCVWVLILWKKTACTVLVSVQTQHTHRSTHICRRSSSNTVLPVQQLYKVRRWKLPVSSNTNHDFYWFEIQVGAGSALSKVRTKLKCTQMYHHYVNISVNSLNRLCDRQNLEGCSSDLSHILSY